MRSLFVALVISLALSVVEGACAGEPKKQPNSDWIPLPQPVMPPLVLPYSPPPPVYNSWQYYGVDSTGRFRPRIVLSPSGSYDMYTHEPYPWITNRSTAYMPINLGAPGGSIQYRPTIVQMPAPTPVPRMMPYAVD
jgi:hypothetical protein